jgi:hypothetical protein
MSTQAHGKAAVAPPLPFYVGAALGRPLGFSLGSRVGAQGPCAPCPQDHKPPRSLSGSCRRVALATQPLLHQSNAKYP